PFRAHERVRAEVDPGASGRERFPTSPATDRIVLVRPCGGESRCLLFIEQHTHSIAHDGRPRVGLAPGPHRLYALLRWRKEVVQWSAKRRLLPFASPPWSPSRLRWSARFR